MSNWGRGHFVAVAAAACVLPLAACSGDGGETEGQGGADVIQVAIVPKVIHPWYEDVRIGFDEAAEELAGEGVTVEQEWFSPQTADVSEWTQKIEAAIQSAPDVLAISCLDPSAGVPLINEATAAGIDVLTYDTGCEDSDALAFIGHADATDDGYELGQKLADELGGEGEVAVLAGSPGSLNHEQRVDGFTKAIDENPGMSIVATEYDNDNLESAINLTQSILQAHPDVKGVFGANASAPVGAGQAVKEAGRQGEVWVVGVDDLPEAVELVKEDVILALSVQHVRDIGAGIANSARAISEGGAIEELQETGSFLVDKSNVDSYK